MEGLAKRIRRWKKIDREWPEDGWRSNHQAVTDGRPASTRRKRSSGCVG